MREKLPDIWSIHDVPHCCNLIADFAAKTIPIDIELLVKDIFNHFSQSPKRNSAWLSLQDELNIKPYKMIKHADTRWLTLEKCLDRLIERWEQLKVYFDEYGNDAQHITQNLKKPQNLIYLKLVRVLVKKINYLNLAMQQDFLQITNLHKSIRDLYNHFLNHVLRENLHIENKLTLPHRNMELDKVTIDEQYLKTPAEFDAHIEYLYESEVNLNQLIKKEDEDKDKNREKEAEIQRDVIIEAIGEFIKRACWKMIDVFPFEEPLLSEIKCIFPT